MAKPSFFIHTLLRGTLPRVLRLEWQGWKHNSCQQLNLTIKEVLATQVIVKLTFIYSPGVVAETRLVAASRFP
jgi:hypothetical protein